MILWHRRAKLSSQDRIEFFGGSKEDPTQNAQTYRYCTQCSFATSQPTDQVCAYCGNPLMTGRYVDFEAVSASDNDVITQDDESRTRESHDVAYYLLPTTAPAERSDVFGGMTFRYSRLREIQIYNRGRIVRGEAQPFTICLECGMWHDPAQNAITVSDQRVGGHLPSCTVNTWNPEVSDRVVNDLHLRATLKGDVIEVALPSERINNPGWIESLTQSLLLGMQLEYYIGSGEISAFVRHWESDGQQMASLVFYDTMPGGTGYLRRMIEEIPQIAARAWQHLDQCDCERACYKCLKEFWNQRVHAVLDKRVVVGTLHDLA